jgi:hypothetical protein
MRPCRREVACRLEAGLLTGPVRRALEDAGLGFTREVKLMAVALANGLRAWGYAFTPGRARAMVANGAEAIIVHLGLTGQPAPHAEATPAAIAGVVGREVQLLAHGDPWVTRPPSPDCAAVRAMASSAPRSSSPRRTWPQPSRTGVEW